MKHKISGIEFDTDNIMSQQEFKDAFIQLKALFNDLNTVKSTNVRGFIMKEVFSSFDKVENAVNQIYRKIDQINRKIDSVSNLQMLQTAWANKAQQDEIESQEMTKDDRAIDRALGRFPSLDSDKEKDSELPVEEQDHYIQVLKGSKLPTEEKNIGVGLKKTNSKAKKAPKKITSLKKASKKAKKA